MAFDIEGARKEGYSDAEIADYLASQRKFDIAGARKEGYSDTEIIQHLSAAPAPAPTAQAPTAPAQTVPAPTPAPQKPAPAKPGRFETEGINPITGQPESKRSLIEDLTPMATGVLKPFAAAGQFLGINKPAEVLQKLSEQLYKEQGPSAKAGEFVGEMISPLPIKAAGFAEKGLGYAPKLAASPAARGAVLGGTQAAFTPTANLEGDYLDFLAEKAGQVGLGGGFGAAFGKGTQMLMDPRVSSKMQYLKDLGMKYFTPGQLAGDIPLVGPAIKALEARSTSIPFAGSAVEQGMRDVAGQFNIAAANRILQPLGKKVPKAMEPGEPLMGYVTKKVDDAYTGIEGKFNLHNMIDPKRNIDTYHQVYEKGRQATAALGPEGANALDKELKEAGFNILLDKGAMTGKEFRIAESNLGARANLLTKSRDAADRELGFALVKTQEELRRVLAKQNPKVADELKGIHEAFRLSLPFRRAGSMVGAEGRVFDPSQLMSGVKAKGGSEKAFVSGRSPMYKEAEAGLSVLGPRMPSSGTAERVGTGALIGTLGSQQPLAAISAYLPATAAAYGLYNKPAMRAATVLATERPEAVRKAAKPVARLGARAAGALSANE